MVQAHITEEVWNAKGRELFGDDQAKWRFVCPACGNVMSIEKAREELKDRLPALRAGKYAIEQECVGRHMPGVGCNWAAYGLLHGPLFVKREGGNETPVFDFDGKPFTSEQAERPAAEGAV